MNKLKEKLGINAPFFLLLIVAFAVHMFLPLSWADDEVFVEKAAAMSIGKFLETSARPISDAVTYIFASSHTLWRIINPFILSLFAYFFAKLIPAKEENRLKINYFIAIASIYPCMAVVDAGFIATTVNYMYPGLCALITYNVLKKASEGQKISLWEYLLSIPLTAYAANMQQLGAISVLIFAAATVYFAAKKTFRFYAFFETLLYSAAVIFIYSINVFGDNNRLVRSTAMFFPSFESLSIFQKAELGFSSTFYNLVMNPHFTYAAFLAFTLFICVCVFKSKATAFQKAIGIFPPAVSAALGILSFIPSFSLGYKGYVLETAEYTFAVLPYLFYIPIIASILFSLYNLLGKTKFWASFALLFIGLVSRMIMGFSPTVWASGQRTFFIMYITFIAISALLADKFLFTVKENNQ